MQRSSGWDLDSLQREWAHEEMQHLVLEYFAGTLDYDMHKVVEEHLSHCGACREFMVFLRRLHSALVALDADRHNTCVHNPVEGRV